MVDRAKKITELPPVTSITNNDVFIVVTNTAGVAVTKKITINNFRAGLPPIVVGLANTSTPGTVIVGNNLTTNASGHISLKANIELTSVITDDLEASGNVYLGIVDANNAQLIHVHGTIHSNIVPHTTNNYQLGNTTNRWLAGYIGGITLANNRITFSDGSTLATTVRGSAPTTPTSNGLVGSIVFDNEYIYACVANNVWKRVAISSWL